MPTIGPVHFIVKVDNTLLLKAAFVHASHQHKKQRGEVPWVQKTAEGPVFKGPPVGCFI